MTSGLPPRRESVACRVCAQQAGPLKKRSHRSRAGRSAGRSRYPAIQVQTPRTKGSPSISARHHPLKTTMESRYDEKFVSRAKAQTTPFVPRVRFSAWHNDADTIRQSDFDASCRRRDSVTVPRSTWVIDWGRRHARSCTDLSATRTGRKDSRLSGPIDPNAPSAVAALPFVRRPRCPPPSFFRHT